MLSFLQILQNLEVLTHILSHLSPSSLSTMALVTHRFYGLVTTPHAWRVAFARYFPGWRATTKTDATRQDTAGDNEDITSERRFFTRLTAFASWRSEYILRTRLLRCLARGKPAQILTAGNMAPRWSSNNAANAQITYNSNLLTLVTQLDATFGSGLNKKLPKFIHGAEDIGVASLSDPSTGKVDPWGFEDPQSFLQFAERHPGEAEYGLGAGDVVGVPNSMAVSQMYGLLYADGSPGGLVYYRSVEEQRGRMLVGSRPQSAPYIGVPWLDSTQEAICSVWIAKTSAVVDATDGFVGIISGSSLGVVTTYSLGTNGMRGRRLERGEMTARWVLSPGVPIIAIAVDEKYSSQRHKDGRIWVVALNALGEVYYLSDIPKRHKGMEQTKLSDEKLYELAWESGRSVYWSIAEPTRRVALLDPYDRSSFDGSYTPRGSSDSMGLSTEQIYAETKEIENFACEKPRHFRKICQGWDMRRRLEVDFGGVNENQAGEAFVVFECGLGEGQISRVKRYTRLLQQYSVSTQESTVPLSSPKPDVPSLFGGPELDQSVMSSSQQSSEEQDAQQQNPLVEGETPFPEIFESWRTSSFSFGGLKSPQITTTALDASTFALLTASEDPLLGFPSSTEASSPFTSPLGKMSRPTSPSEIPGQRSRMVVAGTKTGAIVIWNIRASISPSSEVVNTVEPLQVIHTDSPQISCLALSALYLVHGGNDGLVQAWDLLASNPSPIRTINSRFSSRARRRLVQAEASPWGIGINLFAAGAILLDPDPTVLRGMVSLGAHLRYWSYSSQAADQYKSNKRRLRRSERGINHVADRFSHTGRGILQDHIADERRELEAENESRRKEQARLAGRFGLGLLGPGATDDEVMAYATMLSEEAAQADKAQRKSSSASNMTVTDVMDSPATTNALMDGEEDADLAAAMRLSLEDVGSSPYMQSSSGQGVDYPVRYVKNRRSPSRSPVVAGSSTQTNSDDFDFALQLSLAEERSRVEAGVEDFPLLEHHGSPGATNGKGKGRAY